MRKILLTIFILLSINSQAFAIVSTRVSSSAHTTSIHPAIIASSVASSAAASRNRQNQILKNNNPMFADGFITCYFLYDDGKVDDGEVCERKINGKRLTFEEYLKFKKGNVEYLGFQIFSEYKVAIFFKKLTAK